MKSGAITTSLEKTVEDDLKNAITRLRATGTVKANLPYGHANLLNPSDALFLSQADKFDPALLASHVARTPVLLSCSNDDIQVSCNEVDRVARGIDSPSSHVDFVHLRGVDHVLKADASLTGSRFTKSLAFSPQLKAAVRVFVTKYL